jgi:hypothetical protein
MFIFAALRKKDLRPFHPDRLAIMRRCEEGKKNI